MIMFLYGASGHAKVIIDILKQNEDTITGVFDDNEAIIADTFMNYPFLGKIDNYNGDIHKDSFIISIGNNVIRKKISSDLKVEYASAISPKTNISDSVSIGCGSVVVNGASINSCSSIGRHTIINTNSSIDHDCFIDDFVHVSPGVAIAGNVSIGEGSHIGIGASIIQGLKIGKWATIGAGSVILKDIPDYAVVVGNPGRIIKYSII